MAFKLDFEYILNQVSLPYNYYIINTKTKPPICILLDSQIYSYTFHCNNKYVNKVSFRCTKKIKHVLSASIPNTLLTTGELVRYLSEVKT